MCCSCVRTPFPVFEICLTVINRDVTDCGILWNPLNSYQILRNHLDLSCLLTTPLYLLCSTNMLPSSTNSPGASLHQTHGLLLPSAHFGPPFATLKTSGNVLTLLLTGPPSSLSATNTTSSSCLPKRVLLQPRIFSLRQPQTSLANSQ